MSVFEYIALDEKGREKKGIVDAVGISAARQQLRDQGVYPVEIKPAMPKKESALAGILEINLRQKVSAKEIAVFTRQLSTLLGAGIPLVPSFTVLLGQTKNPRADTRRSHGGKKPYRQHGKFSAGFRALLCQHDQGRRSLRDD